LVKKTLIWDPIVRISHWLLVTAFFLNYFLLDPGSNQHQIVGYVAFSAVVIRLLWAFSRSGHAGFESVKLRPRDFILHFSHLKHRNMPSETGHNPIGWLMVIATWLIFIGLATTGFMLEETDLFFGSSRIENIHYILSNSLYAIVIIHIFSVFFVGWWGRVSLIKPMITGNRKG
jgi:cytochrome b